MQIHVAKVRPRGEGKDWGHFCNPSTALRMTTEVVTAHEPLSRGDHREPVWVLSICLQAQSWSQDPTCPRLHSGSDWGVAEIGPWVHCCPHSCADSSVASGSPTLHSHWDSTYFHVALRAGPNEVVTPLWTHLRRWQASGVLLAPDSSQLAGIWWKTMLNQRALFLFLEKNSNDSEWKGLDTGVLRERLKKWGKQHARPCPFLRCRVVRLHPEKFKVKQKEKAFVLTDTLLHFSQKCIHCHQYLTVFHDVSMNQSLPLDHRI